MRTSLWYDARVDSYLVTGGAGFIGSHLVDRLLDRGHRVTALDDLSSGRRENVNHLDRGFRLVVGSVCDRDTVAPLVAGADVVVHLAAGAGVGNTVENPVEVMRTNIHGTEIVVSEAAERGRRLMIASSSEVYGKLAKVPFAEDDDCLLGPTSCRRWSYAVSKIADEYFTLPRGGIAVRFFNTVGPRQRGSGPYGSVLATFVERALAGRSLIVHGSGRQTRCFSHVADVVGGLLDLLETPGAAGEAFNIGAEEEVTIGGLARRVADRLGEVRIERAPYHEIYGADFEDIPRRVPDLSKIRRFIDYRPRFGMDEIIDDVAEHLRGRRINPGFRSSAGHAGTPRDRE